MHLLGAGDGDGGVLKIEGNFMDDADEDVTKCCDDQDDASDAFCVEKFAESIFLGSK